MHPGPQLLHLKSDHPLGARINGDTTRFSLFAPRASHVTVSFFKRLKHPKPKTLKLSCLDDTIWEAVYPKNLHGWYYYYQIDSPADDSFSHFENSFKILDPYALATVGPTGPGIIWDLSRSRPIDQRFSPPYWHDLVIVEAHVRDLIKYAPIALDDDERRGFAALRTWIQAEGSYLKSLGINAVELQPIHEFGDHYPKDPYHWGYMPVNFFSPDSSYALDPERGSQIEEFQELVAASHQQGLAVILDVVYNHFGVPNHLLHIDKYYYFDLGPEGELMNWSGCGNTLRCDAPMVRRLIIDSLIHWIETYDVDGFRFDLAELLGVDVLKDIEAALKRVKPSLILIAEPWSFRGHISHALKPTGFAFWNDGYREFVHDYVMGCGNQEGLRYYMGGSLGHLTAWPAQTINYVESHDDHSWIDRITEHPDHCGHNPTPNDRRRTHLLAAILMASLGVPMISAGQDALRSKQGVTNTYRHGDLNAIDYRRLRVFSGTHEYFRKWIHFRRSQRGQVFRLDSPPPKTFFRCFGIENGSALAILYNADRSKSPTRLLFAINPDQEAAHIPLEGIDLNRWKQLADHERFDDRGLESARFYVSDDVLELPPLSCGLWEE